jgi:hypothetical protein
MGNGSPASSTYHLDRQLTASALDLVFKLAVYCADAQ